MRRTHFTCTIDDCNRPHDARGMCALHYRRWSKKGNPRAAPILNDTGICVVADCGKKSRSPRSTYCEMHYCRLYNHGSLDGGLRNAARGVHETSEGYLATKDLTHPAAGKGGHIYLHRKIFYDLHGAGPHRCHWCSKWVTWAKLKVDHKDENRKNNAPENLLPSCHACNAHRGDAGKVEKRHRSPTITLSGETLTLAQWARRVGIKVCHLHRRIILWPLERALTEPGRKHALRKPKQISMIDELFDVSAGLVEREAAHLARATRAEAVAEHNVRKGIEARANRMKS